MAITPGTWEVWQSPSGKWAVKAVYEDDQGNRHTAWPAVCNATGEDNEANARLIAAAPKLQEENTRLKAEVERLETAHLPQATSNALLAFKNASEAADEYRKRAEAAEARLAEALEVLDLFEQYGCPVCHGGCFPTNPPVYCCPMQAARRVRKGGKIE